MYVKKGTERLEEQFAVLIISCDKYSDLWQPFFELFWRFWPDCPFKVYLLSNNKGIDDSRIQNILVGEEETWSDKTIKGLKRINQDYIFLIVDDIFFTGFIKTEKILEVLEWMLKSGAIHVRFNYFPRPDKRYNELLGIVSPGTLYRTSTQISAWKKDVLLDLLRKEESVWDFEIYGSERSDRYDGFYATRELFIPYLHGVVKGKYQKFVVSRLNSLGVKVDLNRRYVMTSFDTFIYFLKRVRSRTLNFFPAQNRKKIKDLVTRGKYNYSLKEK
jgi:hypothetical protein